LPIWIDMPLPPHTICPLPTVEAEPIKHGHWKIDEDVYEICASEFTCSVCGKSFCSSEMTDNEVLEMMKYCPECGAKMDEESE
jgi:ribosomal protein L33